MRHDMGTSDILTDPKAVFVKSKQWALKANNLSAEFITNVSFDYQNKQFTFGVYEVLVGVLKSKLSIDEWVEGIRSGKYVDECFVFKTFDACDNVIYEKKFEDISIVGETSSFSYDDKNPIPSQTTPCIRYITISYDNKSKKQESTSAVSVSRPYAYYGVSKVDASNCTPEVSTSMSDYDILTKLLGYSSEEANEITCKAKAQKLEELKLQVLSQNPSFFGVAVSDTESAPQAKVVPGDPTDNKLANALLEQLKTNRKDTPIGSGRVISPTQQKKEHDVLDKPLASQFVRSAQDQALCADKQTEVKQPTNLKRYGLGPLGQTYPSIPGHTVEVKQPTKEAGGKACDLIDDDQKLDTKWYLSYNNVEFPVIVDKRPAVHIDQHEINYLNSKVFLPGKTTWEPFIFKMPGKINDITSRYSFVNKEVSFNYHYNNKIAETWTCSGVYNVNFIPDGDFVKIVLEYKNAKYQYFMS